MTDKSKKRIQKILLLVVIPIIFIVIGHYWAIMAGKSKEIEIRNDVSTLVQTISSSIDPEKFKTLSSTPEDNTNPEYLFLRESFLELGEVNKNSGIRWLYTFILRDEQIVFSVDSIQDENHSEPGDIYYDAGQDFMNASYAAWNNGKTSIIEPYTDQWGTFVSAITPIVDSEGKTVSVLGVDVDYDSVYLQAVNQVKIIPYFFSIIFALLYLMLYVYIIFSKKSREREKNEKLRLQYALDGAGDGLWDWDLITNQVFYSKRWKEMLGFTDGEIKQELSEWKKRVHPEDKEKALEAIDQHIRGITKTYENVQRILCKNGESKWFRDRGRVVDFDKNGKPIRMVGTLSDLDAFKKIEIELGQKVKDFDKIKTATLNVLQDVAEEKEKYLEISEKLQLATHSARIGLLELDLKTNLMNGDDMLCEIYFLPKDSMRDIGFDDWKKMLIPEDLSKITRALSNLIEKGKILDEVFRINLTNGDVRYIKGYATVKKDKQGKPERVVGVNIDITREYEIDKAKTEFVSLASHQLKTPVGAISWNAEMLLDGDYGKLTKKQKPIIEGIHKMNRRMADLVNGFLNISRIELGTFVIDPVDVVYKDVCEDVLKELEEKIKKKNLVVNKEYDSSMPNTVADNKLLTIIFQNLLSNAVKYTNEKGIINIYVGINKNDILIKVSNNGDPIPVKDQSKIFQKLFRASNAQGMDPDGNGLGLYLLKSIVENAGGTVGFKSSEKIRGTEFYVSFPLPGMKKKEGAKHLS